MRTNFQPALRPTTTSTVTPPTNHPTDAQQQQQALPRFRGPYQVNDEVRVRFPQVPKGCSPFLTPRRVIEVLGNYTYKLNDGQVWNARKLVRHRKPPPQFLRVDEDDEAAAPERQPPQQRAPRQWSRRTRGHPPIRYPYKVKG